MMVRIHDVYQMHSIFIHGFPGLLECFYVQERLTEQLMPEVYISLVSCSVPKFWEGHGLSLLS